MDNEYTTEIVEGITFYIHQRMLGKKYEIKWFGLWILGQLIVKEIA